MRYALFCTSFIIQQQAREIKQIVIFQTALGEQTLRIWLETFGK